MAAPRLTKEQVIALKPCGPRWVVIARKLPDGVALTVAEAREHGASFDDLAWVVAAAARNDEDVERRVRLWLADCAARVAHLAKDKRVDDCIASIRAFARGEIDGVALDAARAAVRAAEAVAAEAAAAEAAEAAFRAASWVEAAAEAAGDAGGSEEAWQFDRLIARFSDDEPEDWPIAKWQDEGAGAHETQGELR